MTATITLSSEDEELFNRADALAREKRYEEAITEDGYRSLYHRDPWTDEWFGDGPEPLLPYLMEFLPNYMKEQALDYQKAYYTKLAQDREDSNLEKALTELFEDMIKPQTNLKKKKDKEPESPMLVVEEEPEPEAEEYVEEPVSEEAPVKEEETPATPEEDDDWRKSFIIVKKKKKKAKKEKKSEEQKPILTEEEKKKLRKKKKKAKKLRKKKLEYTDWFMNEFLSESEASEMYREYAGRVEELIEYCYDITSQFIKHYSYHKKYTWEEYLAWKEKRERKEAKKREKKEARRAYKEAYRKETAKYGYSQVVGGLEFKPLGAFYHDIMDVDAEFIPVGPDDTAYIPVAQRDRFEKYCENHPIDKKMQRNAQAYGISVFRYRRIKFLQKLNKKNKKKRKEVFGTANPFDRIYPTSKRQEKKFFEELRKKVEESSRQLRAQYDDMVSQGIVMPEDALRIVCDEDITREEYERLRKHYQRLWDMYKHSELYEKRMARMEEQERAADEVDRVIREINAPAERQRTKEVRKWFRKYGAKQNDPAFQIDEDDIVRLVDLSELSDYG